MEPAVLIAGGSLAVAVLVVAIGQRYHCRKDDREFGALQQQVRCQRDEIEAMRERIEAMEAQR